MTAYWPSIARNIGQPTHGRTYADQDVGGAEVRITNRIVDFGLIAINESTLQTLIAYL
jgi:hypothetical protein